jgi:predicted DNA-binding transcriptional regulator YafY
MSDPKKHVIIDYTNWRGERRLRGIRPINLAFKSNEWHPETQWLLEAIDLTDGKIKTFALKNIHSWE